MHLIGWDVYYLAKKYGAVFTDDRHFVHDCTKLVEEKFTSTNQLKAEIAALVTEFTAYTKEYEPSDNYCDLLERLRQLSAV